MSRFQIRTDLNKNFYSLNRKKMQILVYPTLKSRSILTLESTIQSRPQKYVFIHERYDCRSQSHDVTLNPLPKVGSFMVCIGSIQYHQASIQLFLYLSIQVESAMQQPFHMLVTAFPCHIWPVVLIYFRYLCRFHSACYKFVVFWANSQSAVILLLNFFFPSTTNFSQSQAGLLCQTA